MDLLPSVRLQPMAGPEKWTDALIAIPPFVERPSGLLVPTEVARPVVSQDGRTLQGGVPITEDAVFIVAKPPSALEQMRVVIDEDGLGLPVSTTAELRQMVSQLGF